MYTMDSGTYSPFRRVAINPPRRSSRWTPRSVPARPAVRAGRRWGTRAGGTGSTGRAGPGPTAPAGPAAGLPGMAGCPGPLLPLRRAGTAEGRSPGHLALTVQEGQFLRLLDVQRREVLQRLPVVGRLEFDAHPRPAEFDRGVRLRPDAEERREHRLAGVGAQHD